jgi:hypothetical protein
MVSEHVSPHLLESYTPRIDDPKKAGKVLNLYIVELPSPTLRI